MIRSLPTHFQRLAGTALLACLLGVAPAAAAEPSFSGAVQDALGNVLSGVEVLVIAPTTSTDPIQPLASVRTNGEGQFLVESLKAGAYQIAVVKSGYRTYIGAVNTRINPWIQVVLHPQARLTQNDLPHPDDTRWGLRLPRRNILRETEAAVAPRTLSVAPSASRPLGNSPVQLQVDQLFKVATDLQRGATDDSVIQGIETRVNLSTPAGDRGQFSVRGSRERLTQAREIGTDSPSRENDHVIAVFSYDPTLDTHLNFEAAYASRGATWEPILNAGALAVDHQQDGWSVAAGLERALGVATQLDLRVAYAVSSLALRDELVPFMPQLDVAGSRNRVLDANGAVTHVSATDHQFALNFDLRYLDLSRDELRGIGSAGVAGFDGLDGLSAGFRVRDTWRAAPHVSLIYGVGYRQVLREHDRSLFTPHLGARADWNRVELQGIATYYGVANWGGPASTSTTAWQPSERVGYSTTVEFALDDQTTLRGSIGFQPLMAERIATGLRAEVSTDGPAFVTDGNASLSETRLELTRNLGAVLVFAELSRGQVAGSVAAWLPYDLPFQQLAERELGYTDGRIGVNFVPRGTRLSLGLRDVQETLSALPDLPSGQRLVELSLSQNLMRREDLGRWRFLLGLSMAQLTAGEPDDLRQILSTEPLLTTDSRLSAGLSLEF